MLTPTQERVPAARTTEGRAGRRQGRDDSGKRWDVEGLRAVAVAIVVLYHAKLGPFHGGFVGVDVFFVISGFLITGLLLREFDRSGRISIPGFYARRLRRIVPAGTLTIIVTIVAAGFILGPVRIGAIARDGLWSSLFVANFRFISTGTDYLTSTAPPSPLQHFWSLAVEEQFYVVWPILLLGILLIAKRVRRHPHAVATVVMAIGVTASLWWCIAQTTTNATEAYFSPWTRAWELGVGALVALLAPAVRHLHPAVSAVLSGAGLTAVFCAAVAFDGDTVFPGSAAVIPVAGAAAILAAGTVVRPSSISPSRLLGVWPLRVIGELSYTIYLWHWPALIIATQRYPGLGATARGLLMAGCVVLSWLTHRLVENPIRFAPGLVRNKARAVAVGSLIVVVGAAFSNAYVSIADGRVEAARARAAIVESALKTQPFFDEATVLREVALARTIKSVPARLQPPLAYASGTWRASCRSVQQVGKGNLCYLGDANSARTAVLYGDSHAGVWSYALDLIAKRAHIKLYLLYLPNCPNPSLNMWSEAIDAPDTDCDTFHRFALAKIRQLNPSLIVLADATYARRSSTKVPLTSAQWTDGLMTTVRSLSSSGRQIKILGDIPYLNQTAADCLSIHANDVQACSTDRATAVRTPFREAELTVARESGNQYIDPVPWICTDVCTPIVGGYLVYQDHNHLTGLYTSFLAGSLAHALRVGA